MTLQEVVDKYAFAFHEVAITHSMDYWATHGRYIWDDIRSTKEEACVIRQNVITNYKNWSRTSFLGDHIEYFDKRPSPESPAGFYINSKPIALE